MPRRFFNFFTDSSQKSKLATNTSENQNIPDDSTSKRRMSISRSGRFREQKHRSAITENTFSQSQHDDTCSKDQSGSVGKENTAVSDVGRELENEQWESVNNTTVKYMEKKEAASRVIASQGRKETSI